MGTIDQQAATLEAAEGQYCADLAGLRDGDGRPIYADEVAN